MSLILPYKFVGGTSAKAQEVNANFQQIKSFVDNLETNQNSLEATVTNMDANKANRQGTSTLTFQVANPVNNFDAVNKQYLDNQLSIISTIIFGLEPVRSGNKTFYLKPGGCYDSNYIYPMVSRTNLNGNTSSITIYNRTYYIWVIASTTNSNITSIELTSSRDEAPNISVSDTTTIYRRVAYVTVNGSNIITDIGKEE